jgi:hypothetical protein
MPHIHRNNHIDLRAKKVKKHHILALFLLALPHFKALADTPKSINDQVIWRQVIDEDAGFSFNFNQEFFLATGPSSQSIRLILKPMNGDFPTFNIIREACDPRLKSLSPDTQAIRVESDYRRVGLTDSKVTSAHKFEEFGHPAFLFEIQYTARAETFVASVIRIHLRNHCILTTYIDTKTKFEERSYLKNVLLSGLRFNEEPQASDQASPSIMLFYLLALSAFGLLLALYRRNLRRKMPS